MITTFAQLLVVLLLVLSPRLVVALAIVVVVLRPRRRRDREWQVIDVLDRLCPVLTSPVWRSPVTTT